MICLRVELSGEINKRASLSQRRTHQPDTFLRQQRGQGNFELATNFDYDSHEGQRDPRESLRRCRISKLTLGAHKVLLTEESIRLVLV